MVEVAAARPRVRVNQVGCLSPRPMGATLVWIATYLSLLPRGGR